MNKCRSKREAPRDDSRLKERRSPLVAHGPRKCKGFTDSLMGMDAVHGVHVIPE